MNEPFYCQRLGNVQARAFYHEVYDQIKSGKRNTYQLHVTNKQRVTLDCHMAIEALLRDKPELFFLPREYRVEVSGNYASLLWENLYPDQTVNCMIRDLSDRIYRLTHPLMDIGDLWDRERKLYQRIALARNYHNTGNWEDHTITGPLLNGIGVCDGYAKTFALMARRLRIPVIMIVGYTGEGSHAWNLVQTDRTGLYHVDVTWENVERGECAYDYFNLTDQEIRRDHDYDVQIQKCREDLNSFHFHNRSYFTRKKDLERYIAVRTLTGAQVIRARLAGNAGQISMSDVANYGLSDYVAHINPMQNTILLLKMPDQGHRKGR